MANVVTDPKVHPEVIIPDLYKADPLLTFTRDDIAFVYGKNGSSGISRKSTTTIPRFLNPVNR
jgi:hypothetical protein